jgi:hypothetical protein
MNALTDSNIAFMYDDLKARGMTMVELKDEMVDHLCCMIEPELSKGIIFQVAYDEIIGKLEDNTFKKIQHQTILSTNLKFQKMKKSMFSFGVIGTLFLLVGTFFKSIHFPMASILLFLGSLIIIFGFLPIFFYTSYKEQIEKKNFFLSMVAFLTAVFFITGALFRIQHWPGANIMLTIGEILLVVGFLPLYMISVFKKANETRTNIIYVLIIIGIGIATMYMSSTVRISKNVVDKYDSLNISYIKSASYFNTTNDSLILNLEGKYPDGELFMRIAKTKSLSMELDNLINTIKTEIVKLADNKNATLENFSSKDNVTACGKVMYRDGYSFKLRNSFENYRNYLLSLAKGETQKQMIATYLDFNLFTDDIYEQRYSSTPVIEAIAILSEIQKNAKLAEYEILKSME